MARILDEYEHVSDTGPASTVRAPDGEIVEQFNKLEEDIHKLHEEITSYLYHTEAVRLVKEKDAPGEETGKGSVKVSEMEEVILTLRIKVGDMTYKVIKAREELRL